jgi:hypothetical protein
MVPRWCASSLQLSFRARHLKWLTICEFENFLGPNYVNKFVKPYLPLKLRCGSVAAYWPSSFPGANEP